MIPVVLQLRGLTVMASTEEQARDFLVCLTGQRLVVLERSGSRRVEPAAKPKSLEEIARKHAAAPLVVAPPSAPARLSPMQARAVEGKPPRGLSPIMQHVRGEDAPRAWAPPVDRAPAFPPPDAATADPTPKVPTVFIKAGGKRGPKPGTVRVQRPALDVVSSFDDRDPDDEPIRRRPGRPRKDRSASGILPRTPVRGADADGPVIERSPETVIADRIVRAFELDETHPLPSLAAELFGFQTGRSVVKLKIMIERCVAKGRLVRTGAASFRVVREDGVEDDEERDSDDQDDEGASFDPSEERPANVDPDVLSELGIGLG